MSLHSWLHDLGSALAPGRDQRKYAARRGSKRTPTHRPRLEALEDRSVPSVYAVTHLGTLGRSFSVTADVNEAGQVVGSAIAANDSRHASLWDAGTMIDLGTLGGRNSSASGINDLGQVVGESDLPGDTTRHAFLINPQGGVWFEDNDLDGRNDLMIDLGTLNMPPFTPSVSEATAINNHGQVVGYSDGHAFLWDAVHGMTDLGVPAGYWYPSAEDINENGQVVVNTSDGYAFLWDAEHGMTPLSAGPAYAINDLGQVVGRQWDGLSGVDRAYLWTPDSPNALTGSFTNLGTLPDDVDSLPLAINNAGQVVGIHWVEDEFGNYNEHAFLWDAAGGMVELQNRLSPDSDSVGLRSADAINDSGVIAASGLLLTPITPGTPSISIADAPAVTEGNTGTRTATFFVSLSAASTETITVAYATGNATATAGSDYQAASGTLTFAPGEMSRTVSVPVIGDRLAEPNETFVVNLSSPINATIADGQGVGTIVDDEPSISISDVTKAEGKKNQSTLFTFTVTLSAAYDQAVTMSFHTVNGTATTSDNDYVAKTGTLTFAPGETTKTITIEVKGDSKKEVDETFYLDLSGLSSNGLFTKSRGIGTILNDD